MGLHVSMSIMTKSLYWSGAGHGLVKLVGVEGSLHVPPVQDQPNTGVVPSTQYPWAWCEPPVDWHSKQTHAISAHAEAPEPPPPENDTVGPITAGSLHVPAALTVTEVTAPPEMFAVAETPLQFAPLTDTDGAEV